jgi:hypothetical protein
VVFLTVFLAGFLAVLAARVFVPTVLRLALVFPLALFGLVVEGNGFPGNQPTVSFSAVEDRERLRRKARPENYVLPIYLKISH